MTEVLEGENPKARQIAALDALDDDKRVAYMKLSSGLDRLEEALPTECTDETRPVIGDTIARCKAVEKFANELFHEIADPLNERVRLQRDLWRPIGERAVALMKKAQSLVETLLEGERRRREEAEAAARALVSAKMAEQAAAEATAMAADTQEAADAAKKLADAAWNETRQAVQALDKAPATTSVKVGETTVYEASRLDFEILDMGKFAAAHPDLVDVRRGQTLAALRHACAGLTALPETIAGFPGVRLKLKKTTSSRS
jgi:hypothetical protein